MGGVTAARRVFLFDPNEHDIPAQVAARGDGWRRKVLVEHADIPHVGHLESAPVRKLPGPAFAADLVDEQVLHAVEVPVRVRLRDASQSVQEEVDQPPVVDGMTQDPVDVHGKPRKWPAFLLSRSQATTACWTDESPTRPILLSSR